MSKQQYDIVIIGAGAGGLIAAGFAVQLGARVALVEKDRIGGDCTWIGCVPSKALLKVAKIAHHVRTASQYGIMSQSPVTDMVKVHEYLDAAIQHIYKPTTPEALRQKGMDVYLGPARFADKESIIVGDQTTPVEAFPNYYGGSAIYSTNQGPRLRSLSYLRAYLRQQALAPIYDCGWRWAYRC